MSVLTGELLYVVINAYPYWTELLFILRFLFMYKIQFIFLNEPMIFAYSIQVSNYFRSDQNLLKG